VILLGGFLVIVFIFGFLMLAFFGEFEAGRLKRKDKVDMRTRTGDDDDAGTE
jgi:hypothetical protein